MILYKAIQTGNKNMIGYILAFTSIVGGGMILNDKLYHREFKAIPADAYTLICGHHNFKPIEVNMLSTPHLLISGLSGQGKSRCLKAMLLNLQETKKANIILMNAFKEDYKGIKARRVYGEQCMLSTINYILEDKSWRKNPLYIVIEELGIIKDKKLNEAIKDLLCTARHYNIYIIGVIQIATKEECKFKSYFNARLTFRQLEDSAYRVVLGCGIGDKILNKQDFALVSDDLHFGRTYYIE